MSWNNREIFAEKREVLLFGDILSGINVVHKLCLSFLFPARLHHINPHRTAVAILVQTTDELNSRKQ